MKFAEMTQEVQIARPNPVMLDLGFTPGRRQANKVGCNSNKYFTSGMCIHTDINISFVTFFRYSRKQETY